MASELQPNERIVTLSNFDGGSANEVFLAELKKVLLNISDPNTDPEVKREITLQFVFWPDPDRKAGKVAINSKCKLAPRLGSATTLYFGKIGGEMVAVESDPNQGGLFDPSNQPKPTQLREVSASKTGSEE